MVTIIGIAGGSASGKTTIARKIFETTKSFGSVILIRLDDYYQDLSHLPLEERRKINFDHPDSLDFDLLINHLNQLRNNKSIRKPIYDFVEHNRSPKTELIYPANVILVEGILTLALETLRELFDIKIFVDTDDDIRFIRRLQRDIRDRGRTVENVIDQYLKTVKPMHHQFVEPSRRYADVIIPEGGYNSVAIDMVITKITSLIKS